MTETAIEWYIKILAREIKYLEKRQRNGRAYDNDVDFHLGTIIHRAYQYKYCLDCDRKEDCKGICYDTVEGWGDLLIDDSDKIKESWRYKMGY